MTPRAAVCPSPPDVGNRLRPWICLVVLEDADGVTLTPSSTGPDA
ncbi:MAG TPA: hypothetical protein VKE94_20240 [Gemmataceae bacterium]|nr:hypothetical protein [Gemmataceae bacterium]